MLQTIIRRILNPFGVDIVRFYQLPGTKKGDPSRFEPLRNTMEEALKHLQRLNFNPSVIVDVGAANGTFPLLKVYPGSRYLWIEPLVEFQKDLKQLAAKYKGDYILAAAGKSNGSIKLNVHPDLGGSSTHREADGIEADGIEREVKLIKLDDLIDQYGLNRDVLLKVDVQGAELEVLEGAPQLMQHCEVIILEVSFFKFLKTNPEFFDVVSYMKSKGFVAYDIFDGHNRPLDHALAQKDILFVKEDGFPRKSHNWATLDQRRAMGRRQVQR